MQTRQIFAIVVASAAMVMAGCATQSTPAPAPAPAPRPAPAAPPPAVTPPPAASGASAAITARQGAMRQVGGAARALNGAATATPPDLATIQSNGRTLAQIAAQLPSLFPAGSGPESGVPTRATAAVWSNASGFATEVRNFTTAANAVANATTPEAGAAAARAIGGTCQSCHSQFRGPAQ